MCLICKNKYKFGNLFELNKLIKLKKKTKTYVLFKINISYDLLGSINK